MTRQFDHWIGGKSHASASGRYIDSVNPANRRLAGRIADGTGKDADLAVASALAAKSAWAATFTQERSRVLRAVADGIRANTAELAELEREDAGKPAGQARREILSSAALFDFFADVVRTMGGRTIDQPYPALTYTRHEPYGIVLAITPWNAPLNQAARSVAPALAAGNAVISKPSEFTSMTTVRLAQIASEAGLPDGVFNVVTGTGPEVGASLARHPAISKIAFTGSVRTGRILGHIAADRLIPMNLELGGKSPIVVFAGADLTGAAAMATAAIINNAGQVCSATTRMIAARSIHDELVAEIVKRVEALTPGEDFGAIITEPQFQKVLGYLQTAREEGATIAAGGSAYEDGPAAEGQYIKPTVYTGVRNDMTIVREEIFGPVLSVVAFDTDDEAIAIANDTEFGLSATVWAADAAKAISAAHKIQAGQVSVNGGILGQETPFGGYKASGYGRERGIEALWEYSQVKTISVALPA